MKKRRQSDVVQEVPTPSDWSELETFEGFEKFREQMIKEIIETFELHRVEGDGLLKIPIKEMHSLINKTLREVAKFYAQHSSSGFAEWLFQQYYQALGIPFDSNTVKQARENVLHLANKLYELYQRRVKAMEDA